MQTIPHSYHKCRSHWPRLHRRRALRFRHPRAHRLLTISTPNVDLSFSKKGDYSLSFERIPGPAGWKEDSHES